MTYGSQAAPRPFAWGQISSGVVSTPGRTYYNSFNLNGLDYRVGDCVLLYPEHAEQAPYIGRIRAAFVLQDASNGSADPHCIEVTWFDRRTHLDPDCDDTEHEVYELEETDVNPIGCIAGKCSVVKAFDLSDAVKKAKGITGTWFFARGVFRQADAVVQLYPELEDMVEGSGSHQSGRHFSTIPAPPASAPEHVGDSEDVLGLLTNTSAPSKHSHGCSKSNSMDSSKPSAPAMGSKRLRSSGLDLEETTMQREEEEEEAAAHASPPAAVYDPDMYTRTGKLKATGRTCVECGATSTPQWREGPKGPKTLCNACGVRYVRAQQRANKSRAFSRPSAAKRAAATAAAAAHAAAAAAALVAAAGAAAADGADSSAGTVSNAAADAAGVAVVRKPKAEVAPSKPRVRASAATPSLAPSRPQRQAALAAATRTAHFARTGFFLSGEDEESEEDVEMPVSAANSAPNARSRAVSAARSGGNTGGVMGMGGASGMGMGSISANHPSAVDAHIQTQMRAQLQASKRARKDGTASQAHSHSNNNNAGSMSAMAAGGVMLSPMVPALATGGSMLMHAHMQQQQGADSGESQHPHAMVGQQEQQGNAAFVHAANLPIMGSSRMGMRGRVNAQLLANGADSPAQPAHGSGDCERVHGQMQACLTGWQQQQQEEEKEEDVSSGEGDGDGGTSSGTVHGMHDAPLRMRADAATSALYRKATKAGFDSSRLPELCAEPLNGSSNALAAALFSDINAQQQQLHDSFFDSYEALGDISSGIHHLGAQLSAQDHLGHSDLGHSDLGHDPLMDCDAASLIRYGSGLLEGVGARLLMDERGVMA